MALGALAGSISALHAALLLPIESLIATFSAGLDSGSAQLFELLDKILSKLQSYTEKVTNQAEIIADALSNILPSIPFGTLGLKLLRAETLETVKARDNTAAFNQTQHQQEMLTEERAQTSRLNDMNDSLEAILAKMNLIAPANISGQLDEIIALLKEHLPNLATPESFGSAPAFTNWMS
jgi:phage terminase Nu1 subunit (DNA packaging protein)